MRLAYFTSIYPAISHTFVLREVQALRDLGVDIETVSVRRAPLETLLSAAEREEASRTHAILPARPRDLVAAHLTALALRPGRYVRALGGALRTARGGPRAVLWQLFYFAEAILLWDHMRRRGLRHVHVHFANPASDVAMLACAFADGPRDRWTWSFTLHGMVAIPTEFDGVDEHRLGEKAEDALFAICISDAGRSQLMGLVDPARWPAIHVVRCGVGGHWLEEPPERGGDDPDRFELLHVGRIVRLKGQALLLEALAMLRSCGVPARLTIVGDGPERPALERLAARLDLGEALRFTGSVGQDEIVAHYAAADAFCLSSFAEGVPVVLMEAMATGLPVVATQVGGIGELVEDGVSGFLVAPGRADSIADALELLARDTGLRRRMGAAGRRAVMDSYLAERSAADLAEIFRQALGATAAGAPADFASAGSTGPGSGP